MATHGLSEFTRNFEEKTKYKWIGGLGKKENPVTHHDINIMRGTMSNMYYKFTCLIVLFYDNVCI